MRNLNALCLILCLSCGPADPKNLTDTGSAELNSGKAKAAAETFGRALSQMQPSDPDYLRASIGRCQALARTDPSRAQDEFLSFASAQRQRVGEGDFAVVASDLAEHGAIGPATAIAEEGIKRFPESPTMKSLRDRIGDAAKKAGDPESLQKLKGLGYAGDG
jgi:hypothetical protein